MRRGGRSAAKAGGVDDEGAALLAGLLCSSSLTLELGGARRVVSGSGELARAAPPRATASLAFFVIVAALLSFD